MNLLYKILLALLFIPLVAAANPPKTINYQGYLTDSLGIPISGLTDITVTIYGDPDGAMPITWVQTATVTVDTGRFNISLDGSSVGGNPFPSTLFAADNVEIGMKVGADVEMTPRQTLSSVPFALEAENAQLLNGLSSAQIIEAQSSNVITVFNVKAYGALGNGVNNDTDAINTAVAEASALGGGTVYIPCGTYLIGKNLGTAVGFYSGIRITTGNISLVGDGRCSELRPVNSSGNAIVSICSSADDSTCIAPESVSNIKISNLAFRDPNPFAHVGSEESHGIVAKEAINLVVENNYFFGIGDEAVDLMGGKNISVRGNQFDACPSIPSSGGSAISVSGSEHVLISDNSIANAVSSILNRGIDIATNTEHPTSNINIVNNRFFDNNYSSDILFASSQASIENILISSNQFKSNVTAINYSGEAYKQSGIRVVNNDISGNIFLVADELIIAGNTISGNVGNGIKVAGHNVKIVNNIISDFPQSCLFVIKPDSTGPLEFSGNSCIQTSSGNSDVIAFFTPENFTGNTIIKDNILEASVGSKNGIGGGIVNLSVTGNTVSGVVIGIIGGDLVSNNIISAVGLYGINVIRDGALITNNIIKGAGSRCIYIDSADNALASANHLENCGSFAIDMGGDAQDSTCIGNNAANNVAGVNIDCSIMLGNTQASN